jgi:GT2 family glycosyltransferase
VSTSAVVVSCQPGDWLAPCLESLAGHADQVVLVDNGSDGARASQIGRAAGARVVRSSRNQGFAPGVNMGVALATGDVVGLLNDDAKAGSNWLAAASKALEDPTVAAVGPKLLLAGWHREVILEDEEWYAPGDARPLGRQLRSVTVAGTETLWAAIGSGLYRVERNEEGDQWRWTAGRRPWYIPLPEDAGADAPVLVDGEEAPAGQAVRVMNSAGAFLDSRGYAGDIGEGAPDDGRFDQATETFALSGAAFAFLAETWHRLGPFAGHFFAYYEDIDWCWRARLAGMRLLYDPAAVVEHRRSASSGGEYQPWVRVTAERNRTLTMVRNGPRRQVLAALAGRGKGGPDGGVRRHVALALPRAMADRARLARHWSMSPEEVWSTWAGRGTDWPRGPAR